MSRKSPTQRLKGILDEVRDHIEAGDQRIMSWYSDDHDPPEEYPERDKPPHQDLMERGGLLVDFAAGDLKREFRTLDSPDADAELVVFGVGMERILSGIHLKIDPEGYIAYMENTEEPPSPSFKDSKQILIPDLAGELNNEQTGILNLTLEIVLEQRNNAAHLGFHHRGHHQFDRLVLEVAYYLIEYYSDYDVPVTQHLASKVKERRNRLSPAEETIEFDPSDSFD